MQHLRAVRIGEANVAEPNRTRERRARPFGQSLRLGRVGNGRLGGQHLVDTDQRGGRALSECDRHADVAQRPDEHDEVAVEGDEFTDRHSPVDDTVPTECKNCDQAERRQEIDPRQESTADLRRTERHLTNVVGLLAQFRHLRTLGTEALDDANARDRFLDDVGQLCLFGLNCQDRRMDGVAETASQQVDERKRQQGNEREQRLAEGEDHHDEENLHHVRQREGNHHDECLHQTEVARRSAHQLPRLGDVVVADVQALEVGEQPLAQRRFGRAAFAEGNPTSERGEDTRHHPGRGDEEGPKDQRPVALDSLSMPRRNRLGTDTFAMLQTMPTATPMARPRRCSRRVSPSSFHPRRPAFRSSCGSGPDIADHGTPMLASHPSQC